MLSLKQRLLKVKSTKQTFATDVQLEGRHSDVSVTTEKETVITLKGADNEDDVVEEGMTLLIAY